MTLSTPRSITFALAVIAGWLPQVSRDRAIGPSPGGTAIIEGRVTIEIDGNQRPARRARVTLESEALSTAINADTDTEGRYRVEKLTQATYRIRVEKPGFVSESPEPFQLAAAQTLAMNLAMVRGAALEGTITSDTGEPAVDVVVSATRIPAKPMGQTRTDDRGRFRLHSLPAGDYYVQAAAPGINGPKRVSVGPGFEVVGLDFSIATAEGSSRDSTSPTADPPTIAQPDGPGMISGVVTRDGTNHPIPDVDIRVLLFESGTGRQVAFARSSDDGRFVVAGLRAGEYGLRFAIDRSIDLWWGQRLPSDEPRRLRLAEGQHFNIADMVMPRPVAIEGSLRDEFGDPLPGRLVQAARAVYTAGKRRLATVPGAKSQQTDDLGKFRIFNLPPSEYYLVASAGVFAGPGESAGFAVTYYPGTAISTAALPVSLATQDVTGITFQMVPAALSTLSGVITDESGKPAQTTIVLVPTTDGDVRAEILAKGQSGPDGTFVLRDVPAGDYALQAFGRTLTGTNQAAATFGSLQVTVGGNLSNLVVKTSPAVTLRGRVIFEGPAPPPDPSKLVFNPVPVEFATGPAGGGPTVPATNSDWTFEVKNLVGTRVIVAPLGAQGWRLKSVVRNGRDVTDQPIEFRDADVTVEVTLTSNLSTVQGTVTDANKPIAECQVIVFSYDSLKWAYPSRHVMMARSDEKGQFTVTGLPPGNYLAIAFAPKQGQNAQDPVVLEQYRGLATSLTVHEGIQTKVALRVVRR